VADGAPREVLTPERIATVFGVDAVITDSAVGPIPVLRRPL
jgi:ABC-type cobalamin/Fe3+-siderophores transport system ATPase subunit